MTHSEESNGFAKWCRHLIFLGAVVGVFATVIWGMSSSIALNNQMHKEFADQDAKSILERTTLKERVEQHEVRLAAIETNLTYIKNGIDEIKEELKVK